MLKAVTFDFWDTIVHTTDYAGARINFLTKILNEEGFSKERKLIRAAYLFSQKAFYDIWKNDQRYISAAERVELILNDLNITISYKLKCIIIKEFEEIILRVLPPLLPDAEMVLGLLRNRYRIGLICDSGMSPGKILKKVLQRHDVLKYIFVTIFSDEIGYTKPNPRIFKAALKKLKVQPNEVIHVGDLLATDIVGAKAVGMKAIWFNWKNDKKNDNVNIMPDYEINRLSQLLQIIT